MSRRSYGLGESTVIGAPVIGESVDIECPYCHAPKTFEIRVKVNAPPLLRISKGGEAIGRYIGCAACPFASPMVTTEGHLDE